MSTSGAKSSTKGQTQDDRIPHLHTHPAIFARYLDYLESLVQAVRHAHREDWSLEQTLGRFPLPERFAISTQLSSASFYKGLHPYNLQRSFLETQ